MDMDESVLMMLPDAGNAVSGNTLVVEGREWPAEARGVMKTAGSPRGSIGMYHSTRPVEPRKYFVIDVAARYGTISFETILKSHRVGLAALSSHDFVKLYISEGTHTINMSDDLFVVDGVQAAGEYAVEGAGMHKTILMLNQGMNNMIKGDSFKNVAWRDLTFSHTAGQTTKGTVVATDDSSLTVDVPVGFPTPAAILEQRYPRLRPDQGLYMLQCDYPPSASLRDSVLRWQKKVGQHRVDVCCLVGIQRHHLGRLSPRLR